MRAKDSSVNLQDLHPRLLAGLWRLDRYWRDTLGYETIITSGVDGKHSDRSAHYVGLVADVRTWTTASSGAQLKGARRKAILEDVKALLGPRFIVLDKKYGRPGRKRNTHFHVQLIRFYDKEE